VEPGRDDVEAFRNVLGVSDLVGVSTYQLREAAACTLHQREEVLLVGRAVQHAIVQVRIECRAHLPRQYAAGGNVHVGPALERWKVAARVQERSKLGRLVHVSKLR
jgi:thiamine monophosphate synthase